MLSNVNTLRILIPKFFYDRNKFLSYAFKPLTVKNVHHIDTTYPISQFVYELFFFLTILDNSLFSILNDFFFNDDIY